MIDPFEYWSAIQYHGTGTLIGNHLNSEQINVYNSHVFVIQMFNIQIPTVLKMVYVHNFFRVDPNTGLVQYSDHGPLYGVQVDQNVGI